MVEQYVAGRIDKAEAIRLVREACLAAGLTDERVLTDEVLGADVEWYARGARKGPNETRAGEVHVEVSAPKVERTTLGQGGRLVIPAAYREALDLKEGDELTLWLGENEVHLIPTGRVLKHVQALVRRYVPEGHSLADELIAERREEASRE